MAIRSLQVITFEVYLAGIRKRTMGSIYLPPTDHDVREENMADLLNQLPLPIIQMGDFNAQKQKIKLKREDAKINTR